MSDRFLLHANCAECGTDLNQPNDFGFQLMLPAWNSIKLTCPQCRTKWRFTMDVVTRQEMIVVKKRTKMPLRLLGGRD